MKNCFDMVYDHYCRIFRETQVNRGTSPRQYGMMIAYDRKGKKKRQKVWKIDIYSRQRDLTMENGLLAIFIDFLNRTHHL